VKVKEVSGAQVREWLDCLRQEPGWELVTERIKDTQVRLMAELLVKGRSEREADYIRGAVQAYESVLEMCKEMIGETLEESTMEES
jgi:hypothetical protein